MVVIFTPPIVEASLKIEKFINILYLMQNKNEWLATVPFDLYSLTLFELVADQASFTAAAIKAGLTQSAISRRIDSLEKKLGVKLFERTTRRVQLTLAGEELYGRTKSLLTSAADVVQSFQESQRLRPQILRVGASRSIGLSYLPGYFFAFRRKRPDVVLRVAQETSREILRRTEEGGLDVGLVSLPAALPRSLTAAYGFDDEFVLILPPGEAGPGSASLEAAKRWTEGRDWLLIDGLGVSGAGLRDWLKRHQWKVSPAMELDSFDTIVSLVSMGLGVSLVPSRALALFRKRRDVKRVSLEGGYVRRLAIVVQRSRRHNPPLDEFVSNVLF